MRSLFILALCLAAAMVRPLTAEAGVSIGDIRLQYIRAVESASEADAMLQKLANERSNPLLIAYKGAAEALVAKHSWNPYTKMKYLSRSMETLKQAVRNSPADPEIRFLRFSIQHYVPSYLGYSVNLNEDRFVIMENLYKTSGDVRKVIVNFLLECGRCTASEKEILKRG